mgnify:CR=1 FL=1
MVSPDKSAGKQLHEGLASLLAATVSNSGKTCIEIARQTSIHKDALRRILTKMEVAVVVPSWTELVIFVVVAALVFVLIWHFQNKWRRK